MSESDVRYEAMIDFARWVVMTSTMKSNIDDEVRSPTHGKMSVVAGVALSP